jgi:hypothetical protein
VTCEGLTSSLHQLLGVPQGHGQGAGELRTRHCGPVHASWGAGAW